MKSLAGYARPVPYVSRRTSFDGLGTGSSVFNARGPIITRCGSSVLGGAGIGAMIGMHPFVAVAIAFGLGWVASKHKSR